MERTPDAPGDAAACAGLAGDVQHHLKSMVGVTCAVVVKAPGEVPRRTGEG